MGPQDCDSVFMGLGRILSAGFFPLGSLRGSGFTSPG